MRTKEQNRRKVLSLGKLAGCSGAILLLFLFSTLFVACGSSASATGVALETPEVTVTISMDRKLTPPPAAPDYYCGAWVTNSTPPYNPGSVIPVNMKFVHLENGVPRGVGNATATVVMTWANGSTDTSVAHTTADGLAIAYFTIPHDGQSMINKNSQATVTFTAPDGATTCTVDGTQAAFFTLVVPPTPTKKPMPKTKPTKPGRH